MADGASGPANGIRNVVEGVKVKAKELIGSVGSDRDTATRGVAQHDDADARRILPHTEAGRDGQRAEGKAPEPGRKAS